MKIFATLVFVVLACTSAAAPSWSATRADDSSTLPFSASLVTTRYARNSSQLAFALRIKNVSSHAVPILASLSSQSDSTLVNAKAIGARAYVAAGLYHLTIPRLAAGSTRTIPLIVSFAAASDCYAATVSSSGKGFEGPVACPQQLEGSTVDDVALSAIAPASVKAGQRATYTAIVTNLTSHTLHNVAVGFPVGDVVVNAGAAHLVRTHDDLWLRTWPTLAPHVSASVSATIELPSDLTEGFTHNGPTLYTGRIAGGDESSSQSITDYAPTGK